MRKRDERGGGRKKAIGATEAQSKVAQEERSIIVGAILVEFKYQFNLAHK